MEPMAGSSRAAQAGERRWPPLTSKVGAMAAERFAPYRRRESRPDIHAVHRTYRSNEPPGWSGLVFLPDDSQGHGLSRPVSAVVGSPAERADVRLGHRIRVADIPRFLEQERTQAPGSKIQQFFASGSGGQILEITLDDPPNAASLPQEAPEYPARSTAPTTALGMDAFAELVATKIIQRQTAPREPSVRSARANQDGDDDDSVPPPAPQRQQDDDVTGSDSAPVTLAAAHGDGVKPDPMPPPKSEPQATAAPVLAPANTAAARLGIVWDDDRLLVPAPLTVASIDPGGPAARAGIVAGDVVEAIASKLPGEFEREHRRHPAGAPLIIRVRRGKALAFKVEVCRPPRLRRPSSALPRLRWARPCRARKSRQRPA
jgi:hypothetical protein